MNRNRYIYAYSVLKYVHDVVSGESLNVGTVVLHTSSGELSFRHAQSLDRVATAFPSASLSGLRSTLRWISESIDQLNALSCAKSDALPSLLEKILPTNTSSLQWSNLGSGVANSTSNVVDELYERFVSRCFRGFDEVESAIVETKRYSESRHRSILRQASNDDLSSEWGQLEAIGGRR